MTSRADFRQYALDCMREAESADNAPMCLTMFGLARIWMDASLQMDEHVMRTGEEPAREANPPTNATNNAWK